MLAHVEAHVDVEDDRVAVYTSIHLGWITPQELPRRESTLCHLGPNAVHRICAGHCGLVRLAMRDRFYKILRYMIVKGFLTKKTQRTASYLGYTWDQLKEHIINHPNWENVKDCRWHLDHIFPLQAFLDYDVRDPKVINALDNLRPITQEENIAKCARYDTIEFKEYLRSKGIELCQ